METVRDTVTQAADTIGNTLGLTGNQKEEHRSMVDGEVRTGTPGQGHLDGPQSKDFASQPEGPNPDQKPQGANVIGGDEINQNSNPMSNKNEPNTGFGGGTGAAQPSVDARPRGGIGSGSIGGGMGGGITGGTGMKLPEDKREVHHEGTGTKHEKSTGLKADGGDFDASRPGAGLEADRIMDQKGIHHGLVSNDSKATSDDSSSHHSGHSKGLGEKLKDKLHH